MWWHRAGSCPVAYADGMPDPDEAQPDPEAPVDPRAELDTLLGVPPLPPPDSSEGS